MLLEVLDQCIGGMKIRVDHRVLREKLTGERKDGETIRDAELEVIRLFRSDRVVRPDTSPAINDAAEIRMLDLVLFLFRTISVVVVIELRDVRIVALDQPAARCVPLLSGECDG